MAAHNKKLVDNKKVGCSVDLERLKRSPYLVSPILSPKQGQTSIKYKYHVNPYGNLTKGSEVPMSKEGHSPRGAQRSTMHEDNRLAAGAANYGSEQGLTSLQTSLTEQYSTVRRSQSGQFWNTDTYMSDRYELRKQVQALNVHEYYLSSGKLSSPTCADFVGPVKVQEVGNGIGRGLVLTADVELGDILVVSNPLARLYKEETEMVAGGANIEETDLWTDASKGGRTASDVLQDQLVRILRSRATKSSHDRALLLWLCSQREESLAVPSMSDFQNDNDEQTPSSTLVNNADGTNGLFVDENPMELSQQEVERMTGVVRCNAYGHIGVHRDREKKIYRSLSCGIWILPSFINHSCTPNCAMVLVGDAMFVVASRKMQLGSQLTVAYFDIFRPLKERRISMQSWKFMCHCKRCELEESLHESLKLICDEYTLRSQEKSKLDLQPFHTNDACKDARQQKTSLNLADLAEEIQEVLGNVPGLTNLERSWIRGSFIKAYLADGRKISMAPTRTWQKPHEISMTHLEIALESAEAICRGQLRTLQIAVSLLESARSSLGNHSFLVNAIYGRTLNCCRCLFGCHIEEVLLKLIKAAASCNFPWDTVFLERN